MVDCRYEEEFYGEDGEGQVRDTKTTLLLIGLEVDLRLLSKKWKVSISVGFTGMALPFGLGCAIAYGLYHQRREDPDLIPINLGVYMLFVGVAMAITVPPQLYPKSIH